MKFGSSSTKYKFFFTPIATFGRDWTYIKRIFIKNAVKLYCATYAAFTAGHHER